MYTPLKPEKLYSHSQGQHILEGGEKEKQGVCVCVEGLGGGVIKQAQGKRDSKVNSQGPVLEADVGAQPLGQMKADRPPGE